MLKDYLYRKGLKVYEGVMDKERRIQHRKWTGYDKFLFICVTCLWIMAAIHLFSGGKDVQWMQNAMQQARMEGTGQENVVSAFGGNIQGMSIRKVTAGVNTYAKYCDTPLTDAAKADILKRVADCMGIRQYTILDSIESENEVKTLSQMDEIRDVICKIVTVTEEDTAHLSQVHQYLYIGITLYDTIDQVFAYERTVRNLLADWNMDATVAVHLKGELQGNLSPIQKNQVIQTLLRQADVEVVMEHRGDDVYTVYAYNRSIGDAVKIGSQNVNVNISMNYDEQQNITNVYYATPIQMTDY